MTDDKAWFELKRMLRLALSVEEKDALRHALQAIEDRAALVDALDPATDPVADTRGLVDTARRHMRGED